MEMLFELITMKVLLVPFTNSNMERGWLKLDKTTLLIMMQMEDLLVNLITVSITMPTVLWNQLHT